jgi:hypothetical protein
MNADKRLQSSVSRFSSVDGERSRIKISKGAVKPTAGDEDKANLTQMVLIRSGWSVPRSLLRGNMFRILLFAALVIPAGAAERRAEPKPVPCEAPAPRHHGWHPLKLADKLGDKLGDAAIGLSSVGIPQAQCVAQPPAKPPTSAPTSARVRVPAEPGRRAI